MNYSSVRQKPAYSYSRNNHILMLTFYKDGFVVTPNHVPNSFGAVSGAHDILFDLYRC